MPSTSRQHPFESGSMFSQQPRRSSQRFDCLQNVDHQHKKFPFAGGIIQSVIAATILSYEVVKNRSFRHGLPATMQAPRLVASLLPSPIGANSVTSVGLSFVHFLARIHCCNDEARAETLSLRLGQEEDCSGRNQDLFCRCNSTHSSGNLNHTEAPLALVAAASKACMLLP